MVVCIRVWNLVALFILILGSFAPIATSSPMIALASAAANTSATYAPPMQACGFIQNCTFSLPTPLTSASDANGATIAPDWVMGGFGIETDSPLTNHVFLCGSGSCNFKQTIDYSTITMQAGDLYLLSVEARNYAGCGNFSFDGYSFAATGTWQRFTVSQASAFDSLQIVDALNCGDRFRNPTGWVVHPGGPNLPPILALKTYYNASTGKHWTTTGTVSEGFIYQQTVGYLLASGGAGLHPINGCVLGGYDHFLSNTSTCEGQTVLRVEGFAYDSAPSYVQTAQMYRCFNGGSSGSDDHFDATNPSCGPGFTAEGGQGYILTSDMTGQSTTNTMGGGSKSVKKTYCIMADPVNCATGEFYETVHDFSIPGRGLPLQLARTYSSLNAAQDGPLGHGWTDDYNMSLATDASGAMTITEETGSSVTFTPDGSGRYQAPSRVLATLVANADETYTFARQDQQKFTFTAPTTTTVGQLVKETDRNGYATTLGYANGELATVTDSAGRTLTFSYNGDGRIATIVDPIGRTVAFTYSTAGDLTYATDAGGGTTHYTYDPAGTHRLLTVTDPKGGVVTNVYDAAGRVTAQTDAMGRTTSFTYTANADGSQTTTITDPRGDVTVEQYMNNELLSLTKGYGMSQQATWTYTYDPATLGVASTTDPNGHTVYNTYDSRGNLLSHTDALSRTTSYAYDALNDTTAITDPLGVTTAMTYDVNGNLLQTERPLTQTGQTALTTLAYDPAHPGDVVAKTDPNGHTSRYAYDADGNLASMSDPAGDTTSYGYDLIGRKTSRVDPRGAAPGANPISYTTTMTYNAFGQTTAITDPLGRVTADQYDANQNLITTTDPLSHQTVYGYDGNNHRTSTTRSDGTTLSTGYDPAGNVVTRTDALGHSTITSYDALNHVASITDPLNRVTTNAYDPAGNIITMTDPLGRQTVYGYDAANERTSVQHPDGGIARTAYDLDGRIVGQTDPLGHTTTDTYDSLGRLTSVTDPLTRTTVYTYDLAGNRVAMADALNHVTTYQYDAADRLITTTTPLSGATVLDYDPAGNTRARTDANGHTTRQIYDADNELIKVVRPDQGVLLTQYDAAGNAITKTNALGRDTVYSYDLLNRLTGVTDPRGATTAYQFDATGNVITTTDALNHQTVASYDAANEKTKVRQADGSLLRTAYDADGNVITQTDALSRRTVYGYDLMNRVITTTDPLTRTTVYTYDLAGNKTALTDAMGRTTQYGHDADNEVTSITYSDGTPPNVAYTYTATGQRRSMADGTGTTTYQYDALDRPITVTNGAGQSIGYGYDAVGNVTNMTYPDSSVVTRTYDVLDRLSSVTDWLGHTTQFGYDANSNLITETLPNTTSVVQGYNVADQLTAITDTQASSPLWSYGYGRDLAGQVITSTDPLDGKAHSYGYSPLDQLTNDQQSGALTGTATWAPNAAQEITQQVNPTGPTTTTSTYDLAHELTALRVVSGTTLTQSATLSYNTDGDRTSQADAVSGATTTFGYDQADRLTSMSVSATTGITSATYNYDGDGLRQSKVIGTQVLTETWDTTGQLPVLLQDGATRYVTGPDGLPIEQVSSNAQGAVQVAYYLHDQLGSTRALLDSSGNTLATYSYDAYGNSTGGVNAGTVTTPLGFAGQYTDVETGLQYLRARYYDPATAQFVSHDPLEIVTKQPYAYTADDPLNAIDPSGLGCGFLQKESPVDSTQCVGLPTWLALEWGATHRPQAHRIAQWARGYQGRAGAYRLAVTATGALDAVTGGEESRLANWAGVSVLTCSYDYRLGQLGGQVGGIPINIAMMVGSGGSDIEADASLVSEGEDIVGTTHNLIRPTQDAIHPGKVDDYVQQLQNGGKVPPVETVRLPDGRQFILDGHHRYVASLKTGIPVDINVMEAPGPVGYPNWSETYYSPFTIPGD